MVSPVLSGIEHYFKKVPIVAGSAVIGISLSGAVMYGIPAAASALQRFEEKFKYEQGLFNDVINTADKNNNGVLELTETSDMLRVIGYTPPPFYEGSALKLVFSEHETYVSIKHDTIPPLIGVNLSISDLEKYLQVETSGVHREGIPGVFMEKSM